MQILHDEALRFKIFRVLSTASRLIKMSDGKRTRLKHSDTMNTSTNYG